MAKIIVAIEQHFIEYQGDIYTDIAFAYPYWKEYLQVFEDVLVISRVSTVDILPAGMLRADGENVTFIKIRDYLGFWDFLRKLPFVFRDCFKATANKGCFLLRMGNISTMCWMCLILRRKPYAMEFVGHAGQSLLTVRNLQVFCLAKLIAFYNHQITKMQARWASCASYVSKYVRSLYPTRNPDKEWIFSGVLLGKEVITGPRTEEEFEGDNHCIISVGRLEPEKGHAVLLQAVARLRQKGQNIKAVIVGPGQEFENLKTLANKLEISESVQIVGRVPWGPDLFQLLDRASLFVLPSLTEGMPRALIEALARGLPAIGTRAGGIPELLKEDYLAEPSDIENLAEKISDVISDPKRLACMSSENFCKAMEYGQEIMDSRKKAFWECLKMLNGV